MRELDKIAESLFNKIRAQFDHVSLGDEKAKEVSDPAQARFFNFDYIGRNGKNFGNITVSLIDENSLKIYYSSNISDALDETEQTEWYQFLRGLRQFARRNMLQFDTRDINRSNLELKDLKQQSKGDSAFDKEDLNISESRLYGLGNNKRVSFGDVGKHKIIIKHKNQIDPEKRGDRARQIEHVFIETPIGERFLLDHTNLHGARALARHLGEGGTIGDEGTYLINEMIKEMASMRHFVRSMRNRTFEDTETSKMVESAIYRYNEIKNNLKQLQGRKGQELLQDMIENSLQNEETIDVNELRERFVKKIYDDRFNEALPYVYRAYKNMQNHSTAESTAFEDWADEVTENTWANESDDISDEQLSTLFQKPILVGMDAIDAKAAIADIPELDSDDLFGVLRKLAQVQGPDADARRTILGWLVSNGETDLANELMQLLNKQATPAQPTIQQPIPKSQPTGASTMDEPVVNEDLGLLQKLAGLVKK